MINVVRTCPRRRSAGLWRCGMRRRNGMTEAAVDAEDELRGEGQPTIPDRSSASNVKGPRMIQSRPLHPASLQPERQPRVGRRLSRLHTRPNRLSRLGSVHPVLTILQDPRVHTAGSTLSGSQQHHCSFSVSKHLDSRPYHDVRFLVITERGK